MPFTAMLVPMGSVVVELIELTVAVPVELLQVPLCEPLLSIILDPTHTTIGPVMATGVEIASTKTESVETVMQPLAAISVSITTAFPLLIALILSTLLTVMLPDVAGEAVTIMGSLLCHLPLPLFCNGKTSPIVQNVASLTKGLLKVLPVKVIILLVALLTDWQVLFAVIVQLILSPTTKPLVEIVITVSGFVDGVPKFALFFFH